MKKCLTNCEVPELDTACNRNTIITPKYPKYLHFPLCAVLKLENKKIGE